MRLVILLLITSTRNTLLLLNDADMAALENAIAPFNVSISYRDPQTNKLIENMNCIIPEDEVEYYTIQANKVMYKAFSLSFQEL